MNEGKCVRRGSLSALWDGRGNLEVIGWVSPGNDAPHRVCPNRGGTFQSLGLVSYEDWLESVAPPRWSWSRRRWG